jgi:uncharacterized protein YjbI with pentapeptide repeats
MFDQTRNAKSVILSLAMICTLLVGEAGADIYQWEYIDPANPSLGKQPSATICTDGAGVTARPWAGLSYRNLQKGYFIGANLQDANLLYAGLADADFSNANLQEALFGWAQLDNATFNGADVRETDFEGTVEKGFTPAQLYSTTSYQSGDIHGIDLGYNDLSGWNFEGKNLSGGVMENSTLAGVNFRGADLRHVSFGNASIAGADLTGAMVQGARFYQTTGIAATQLYSTASYQTGDLSEISLWFQNLTGWNFAGKNLNNAGFYRATLANADFTGASVRGVNFEGAVYRGFTAAQLYSTASYQEGDLRGIEFRGDDNLTGWNFAGQNLSGASFNNATLTNANFANAKITGTNLGRSYGDQITAAQFYSTASYEEGDLTGVGLAGDNLTGWIFGGKMLANSSFAYANLTGSDLSNANLSHANLYGATLTGANLSGADVRGADLRNMLGFTAAQLYSTANYQAKDLSDNILFADNLMNGWNFSEQNLTRAQFQSASLKNAIFSLANLTDGYFASANLTGANFSQANLTRAYLRGAALTNVVLTGANVQGADFGQAGAGFTAAQLYSTASYQSGDLSGLGLYSNNLTGWNFAGKTLTFAYLGSSNLTNANLMGANLEGATFGFANMTNANLSGAIIRRAYMYGLTGFTSAQLYSTASYQAHDLFGTQWNYDDLSGWNFSGQNLQNAVFGATITGADFSGADTRGVRQFNPDAPINTNLIRPDGSIHGLQLTSAKTLVVRDYDGDPNNFDAPIPIRVENAFTIDATGTLKMQFEGDAWGSLISFAPGIVITLGGTLELDFAAGVNVAHQIGRTFRIFDWSGVLPVGSFNVSSPYAWNLSNLYTTGEITFGSVDALAGDFNQDGTVDASDYLVWRKRGGSAQDFDTWRENFGAAVGAGSGSALPVSPAAQPEVPEPGSIQSIGTFVLCLANWLTVLGVRRRQMRGRSQLRLGKVAA